MLELVLVVVIDEAVQLGEAALDCLVDTIECAGSHSAGSCCDGNHWERNHYDGSRRCYLGLHGPDAWDPYF